MKNLTRNEADNILIEAQNLNDGKWVKHSMNVARVSETLADNLKLDKDKAYIYGLLHDIGRRNGITAVRHIIDGYNYMKSMGYKDIGRYCLTHSCMIKDVYTILGKWDMTEEETKFVKEYLNDIDYTLYDKIVQLSDYMSLPEGLTLIDRRIIDVYLRYGFNEKSLDNWKAIFKIQEEIEEKLGNSIYQLFPEIKEGISQSLIKDILTF